MKMKITWFSGALKIDTAQDNEDNTNNQATRNGEKDLPFKNWECK